MILNFASILATAAAVLVAAAPSATGQQLQQPRPRSPGNPIQAPPVANPSGPRGSGRPASPPLPADQQAEVDRIIAALEVENAAVQVASTNVTVATFATPLDKARLALAHEQLTKARTAWAAKASKLLAESRASGKNLGPDALLRLVHLTGGDRPVKHRSVDVTNAPVQDVPATEQRVRRP